VNPVLVEAAPGRELAVGQFGDPGGAPVFFLHGALASWQYRHPDDSIAEELGVRLITFARPGFGASTRRIGRTVADSAGDVARIADALGIEHFAVVGQSGGGPHALACGALLGERVTAVAAVGSLAPFTRDELFGALGAMGTVFVMARTELAEFTQALQRIALLLTANLESSVRAMFGEEPIPEVPGLIDLFVADGEDALAGGVGGWADEVTSLVRDWGFALSHPDAPTTLWYGESDVLLGAHSEALSAALGVPVTTYAGGHFGFFDHWEAVLSGVVRPARA